MADKIGNILLYIAAGLMFISFFIYDEDHTDFKPGWYRKSYKSVTVVIIGLVFTFIGAYLLSNHAFA